ncbi:hypothetical protein HG536_0D01120 [Torulaspora globosa]|uniref:Uncharacterized protein n=1 Tax=Torulaspora globosa TaxID=48254 RepID=A0A7G3ZGF4_9SACH|nr:uncharacterized protein HG536_0D01120 [Torulaspora globosa]QLL32590.1 hypothetical protein HG536_0D01120 [Torulaspora globosa]
MELRKRKRVVYKPKARASKPAPVAASRPMAKVCELRALQRPRFCNGREGRDCSRDVSFYRDAKNDLERLVKLQEKLYYDDLKVPKLLGPSEECRMLKLPDDLRIYREISNDLSFLIDEISTERAASYTERLPPPCLVGDDANSIRKIAQMYSIDIRDISDSLQNSGCPSRLEIQSISRKLEKPLLIGRDTFRKWPSKPKKRDGKQAKFSKVPLLT